MQFSLIPIWLTFKFFQNISKDGETDLIYYSFNFEPV